MDIRDAMMGAGSLLLAGSAAVLACVDAPSDAGSGLPDGGSITPGPGVTPGPGSDAAAAADGAAPRADGIVRELAYHQIARVATRAELPTVPPVISGNGKRIAFAVAPGTQTDENPNRIFVMDVDGSNLKQVDAYKTNCGCGSFVAISDDGNTIVSTDSMQVRVVDASGTLKGAIVLDTNVVVNVAISAAGGDVFFINARDSTQTAPVAVPRQRGTYAMKSDGSGLTQILSPQAVAPLVGKTNPDDIFTFSGCGTSLSVSGDGAKVFSVVTVVGVGQAVIASGGGGAGAKVTLGPVTEGDKLVYAVAVSRDGNKLGYWAASNAGGEVGVIGADGSAKTKLLELGPAAGCRSPFTISGDGSRLMTSPNALVMPTDGSEPWTLLTRMGSYSTDPAFLGSLDPSTVSMSADGKTFAYLSSDGVVGAQLAVAHLDPADVGAAPKVTEPKVTPSEIPRDLSAGATLSARVSGNPIRVGGQVFLRGFVDANAVHADRVLLADGGVYATDGVNASTDAVPGARVLRIRAEGQDGNGRRSAHAVDFGPFSVK